jgi:D-amino-acid dehydrogenase
MARQTDVLVIGGGSIGVCCAYFLADKSRDVTVIDQDQIGAACSYGNAGVIARSHIIPLPAPGVLLKGFKWMFNRESPLYIKPRLNRALLSWLARFSIACRTAPMLRTMSLLNDLIRASMVIFEELASRGGSEFHFARRGSLAIYATADGFEEGVRQAEFVAPYGIVAKVLDPARVREIEPRIQNRIVGGIYMKDDAHLNPSEFIAWLASQARSKGVSFLTSTEVLGFETAGRRISTIRTTRGDFQADQVVLAAGSWSRGLAIDLGVSLPIQPAKGYSITLKSETRDDSMPLWLSESKVVVTPMGGILRFAGTLELDGLNFSIDPRRLEAIRRAAREYLIDADEHQTVEIWRGLRPLSPDGLPIVGRSRKWANLIIATGHGMQGISLGPITGKLIAQLIANEVPSADVTALGEDRF